MNGKLILQVSCNTSDDYWSMVNITDFVDILHIDDCTLIHEDLRRISDIPFMKNFDDKFKASMEYIKEILEEYELEVKSYKLMGGEVNRSANYFEIIVGEV